MFIIEDITIEEVPCLVMTSKENKDKPLPLFMYYHGFESAREHSLPIGYMLANAGFRVVLPDALHHGVREQGIDKAKRRIAFWDIVVQNIKEMKTLHDYFEAGEYIQDEQVFVAGTSMGGITTAGGLAAYDFIKAAGLMMGTAYLTEYAKLLGERIVQETNKVTEEDVAAALQMLVPFDLSKQLNKLNKRPLFIWHGEKDALIPFANAQKLYEAARPLYENQKNIQFSADPNAGHAVNRAAMIEATNWFKQLI